MRVMVIGAGASGMMAALTASEYQENTVTVLERQARVGRKLLSTGNGRCNLTNRRLGLENYHGEASAFAQYALDYFGVEETLSYFSRLGLVTVTEDSGRVYPFSDSANSVVDVLRLTLEHRSNVEIFTGCEVLRLTRKKGIFTAVTDTQSFQADRVIVCAGGVAGGKLGGTDLGYKLLASFGHSRTKLFPALVQLKTESDFVRTVKGVRCDANVRFCGENGSQERRGELQFTDYGVSGPVIFELSRAVSTGGQRGKLVIDFLPNLQESTLIDLLKGRRETLPQLKAGEFLTGILHNRLGKMLVKACGLEGESPCETVTDCQIQRLCKTLKGFFLQVNGVMGMDAAQVTVGGVPTSEFRPDTLESRLCKGLYAAGEVLDIDGDCGGYNLQWAWSSGRLAGELRGTV